MSSPFDEQQQQVAQLVESIALPMARWNRDAKLIFCNAPYEAWIGKPRSDIMFRSLTELFGASAWASAKPHFDLAFAGERASYERRVRMREGNMRWHRVLAFPDNTNTDRPETIYTIAFDIEDDIRLRQQLAASEARMRSILESMAVPIARLSKDRRIIYCNAGYATLMQRPVSEINGKHVHEVLGVDVYERLAPHYERAFMGEPVIYDRLFENCSPPHWMRVHLQPERDAAGETLALICSFYDIDTDVNARAALEAARKRLDDFADSIPFSLSYIDNKETYRFANREFLRRHALTSEQVVGQHPRAARGEPIWQLIRGHYAKALAGKTTFYERPVTIANGQSRWTRTVYSPDVGRDGAVRGVYTSSFDIHELKTAQTEMARVDAQLSAHLARGPVAVVEYDKYGTIVQWSKRTEEILGRTAQEMIGTKLTLDFIHPEDQAAAAEVIQKIISRKAETVVHHHRYRHASGRYVWVEWYTSVIRKPSGSIDSMMALGVDRTARTESRLRLQRLADRMPNPVTYLDLEMRYEFVNTAFVEWTGVPRMSMIGNALTEIRCDVFGSHYIEAVKCALTGEESTLEKEMKLANGAMRWIQILFSPDLDADGRVLGCYTMMFDIHESRVREANLRTVLDEDPLTGLLTRRALFNRLDELLSSAISTRVSVFFVDLDGFKLINDSRGHTAGDEVLAKAAREISSCLGREELVARLGGDEFVIVSTGTDHNHCDALAHRIVSAITSLSARTNDSYTLSASVGIAVKAAESLCTSDELIRRADGAMYVAKRAGGAQVRFAPL